jgi:hypothetical protein
MSTMDDTAAREIVQRHVEEVLALAGWAGFSGGGSQPVPCLAPDGHPSDSHHYMSGSFQLIVPLDHHRSLIDRVARGWAAHGYTVTPVTTFADGGAKVTARTADDFVDMTLGSGEAPAMVLVIVTACYRHQ